MSSVRNASQGPMPLVRVMVNSELCARRAITKMVPMSTVMGSNSYQMAGNAERNEQQGMGRLNLI